MTTTECLLTITEVQRRTGMARSTIYYLMRKGQFPIPLKAGGRIVRWKETEIDAWIDSRPRAEGDLGPQ